MKFRLSPGADPNGTSLQGTISVAPARIVEVFGSPKESDGYKVSGQWVFESSDGDVFTLYEYKVTSLYDPRNPTPELFWSSDRPYRMHIGARSDDLVEDFTAWLEGKLR